MISPDERIATNTNVQNFADGIGEDGMFVLKLVGSNSSDLLVQDVVANLWKMADCPPDPHRPSGVVIAPVTATAPPGVAQQQLYPTLSSDIPEKSGALKSE